MERRIAKHGRLRCPFCKNNGSLLLYFFSGLKKMLTGDYPETAIAIVIQVHLGSTDKWLTGKETVHLSQGELIAKVREIDIFARMFPVAKLKVINALIENGEVVAMTGDGVNDAPALKAAHIGIAMGKRGSEVAKNAASIIIADDDLGHIADAVALGRKIYDNLKKAIQYIDSIHIPIILIVTIPLPPGLAIQRNFYTRACYIFRIDHGANLFYYLWKMNLWSRAVCYAYPGMLLPISYQQDS